MVLTVGLTVAGVGRLHAQDEPEPCAPGVSALLVEARAALEETIFEAADQALDRASRCDLDQEQLERWLVLRTLVAYADERLGALDEALHGLVSLGLTQPPPILPPPVARRFEELRRDGQAITVAVEPVVAPANGDRRVGLVARVVTDPGRLVRDVGIYVRDQQRFRLLDPGDRLTVVGTEEEVHIPYFLRATGPGGATVLERGSERAPLRIAIPGTPPDPRPLRIGLALGGVFLVVAVVAVGVAAALTDGFRNGETEITGPMGFGS